MKQVLEANKGLAENNLVALTWGNASGIDRSTGKVAIKASGVPYRTMEMKELVVTDLDGNRDKNNLNPSTDLPTHLCLYQKFPHIGGIVHTHSTFATVWAQMGEEIPCLGTTHADYFPGPVPVTRRMTKEEITSDYEWNTGLVIAERFQDLDPDIMRAVLVYRHGVFVWGKDAAEALHNAIVLENVAKLEFLTAKAGGFTKPIESDILKKHYDRKFGKDAYYGQAKKRFADCKMKLDI